MKQTLSSIVAISVFLCQSHSVFAQEASCDGPVLKLGSSVNTCGPCDSTLIIGGPAARCPGVTGYRNNYYHCGGDGFYSCSERQKTVGQSWMPCTTTSVSGGLAQFALDYTSHLQAVQSCNGNIACVILLGSPPSPCSYIACAAGTTGGTPIIFPVLETLGSDGCCEGDE